MDLEVVEPRDLPRLQREKADLVVDWDFLPEDHQAKLLNGTPVKVVAVHGFNLGESLSSFLPPREILFTRHLDDHLFRALAEDDASGAA